MSGTTKISLDTIQSINQMMEDLAGDEFEDFDLLQSSFGAIVKHNDIAENLEFIDILH